MQQLTLVARGKLEWWDVPVPKIDSPTAAIVAPLAVARCDLDLAMIYGRAGLPDTPFAFGHEFVAEVVDVGSAVTKVKPGDRVLVSFQISCGTCDYCRRGTTAACVAAPVGAAYGMAPIAGTEFGGALSELVRVPFADAMLVPVPPTLPLAALASAADNLPDGLRTVAPHLAAQPGAEVLIVGGGAVSVGLYAAAAAVALGSRRVTYIDTDPKRLALAEAIGARTIDLQPTADTRSLGPVPITVDASANPDGLRLAIRSTEPFGICTSVGIYFTPTTPVPLAEMYWRGITFITARVNSAASLTATLDALQDDLVDPLKAVPVVTVPWDKAPEALLVPSPKLVVMR